MPEHGAVDEVSHEDLTGYEYCGKCGSQSDGPACELQVLALQKIPSAYSRDQKRRCEIGGSHHMRQSVEPRWVHDNVTPAHNGQTTIMNGDAAWRLHPTICREYPGG